MDYLLTAIFGKRALGQLSFVEWAGEMLTQGYDSVSLRMLAGLNRLTSTSEAEHYFLRSIKELNLTPPEVGTAIRAYACEIAQLLVDGKITGRDGVRRLYQICIDTDYASDFIIWLELNDALYSLLHGNYPFTYESATLENFDEIAKQEAANYRQCGAQSNNCPGTRMSGASIQL
jgi:hypothetical protein